MVAEEAVAVNVAAAAAAKALAAALAAAMAAALAAATAAAWAAALAAAWAAAWATRRAEMVTATVMDPREAVVAHSAAVENVVDLEARVEAAAIVVARVGTGAARE